MILITQPNNGSEIEDLSRVAIETGWLTLKTGQGWRLPQTVIDSKVSGAPYGTQTFCEVVAQQMNWELKQNSFDWLANLPEEYLKRNVKFMTLAEAKKLKQTFFVKPADDKIFLAGIYPPYTLVTNEVIDNNSPCLVSDIVKFVAEYRCFVTQQQVATCSCYLLNGEINEEKNWTCELTLT